MDFQVFARIGRLEHADPVGVLAADIGLARADVHDVRIRGRNRDGSNRPDGNSLVRDREPCAPGIHGFPHAPTHRAHVERVRLLRVACHRVAATAAHGSYVAPLQAAEQTGRILRCGCALLRLQHTRQAACGSAARPIQVTNNRDVAKNCDATRISCSGRSKEGKSMVSGTPLDAVIYGVLQETLSRWPRTQTGWISPAPG